MTRNDYKVIARGVYNAEIEIHLKTRGALGLGTDEKVNAGVVINCMLRHLSIVLKEENQRFNHSAFVDYYNTLK